MPEPDRQLNLLVQASRTSPPLRKAVAAVEAELRRIRRENEALWRYYCAADDVISGGDNATDQQWIALMDATEALPYCPHDRDEVTDG